MWKDTEWTIVDIWWWLAHKDESKMTPKLRAFVVGLMSQSPIAIWGTLTFDSCCLDPIKTNSVFSSFNLRKFSCIHWQISQMHNSIDFNSLISMMLIWFERHIHLCVVSINVILQIVFENNIANWVKYKQWTTAAQGLALVEQRNHE